MTFRSKLLILLLPPLIVFIALTSSFFYYNWQSEISYNFENDLKAGVFAIANHLAVDKVRILLDKVDRKEPIWKSSTFQQLYDELWHSKQTLAFESLFIVAIEKDVGPASALAEKSAFAYRQRYIVDVALPYDEINAIPVGERPFFFYPGDEDVSETEEIALYKSKQPLVTPPYREYRTGKWLVSGYAPLIDDDGQVVALLGADVPLQLLHNKLWRAASVIALSAIANLALVVVAVLLITSHIARPFRLLSDSALEIAAGHYGHTIELNTLHELSELANTLNTLSVCLQQQQEQQRSRRMIEEKLFGEQECAQLLQRYMFDEAVANFHHTRLKLFSVSTQEAWAPHGFYLQWNVIPDKPHCLSLSLLEGKEAGFSSLYGLLQQGDQQPSVGESVLYFDLERLTYSSHSHNMPPSWIWSRQLQTLHSSLEISNIHLQPGDIIIAVSRSLMEILGGEEGAQEWLSKIFRYFTSSDVQLLVSMVHQQTHQLCDSPRFEKDLFVLLIQVES